MPQTPVSSARRHAHRCVLSHLAWVSRDGGCTLVAASSFEPVPSRLFMPALTDVPHTPEEWPLEVDLARRPRQEEQP